MLVFVDANIVLFAVPKTGSTAYHMALRGKADISLAHKANLKHMTARKYDRDFGPYLQKAHGLTPERVAVIRDPLEQLRSWYRYRQDPKRKGKENSASGLSFDEFVLAAIEKTPPVFANVGSQFAFVTDPKGQIRIDHLFAYEKPAIFRQFLEQRLGRAIITQEKNVSPRAATPISAEVEEKLRAARAEDFALHAAIVGADGHLRSTLA